MTEHPSGGAPMRVVECSLPCCKAQVVLKSRRFFGVESLFTSWHRVLTTQLSCHACVRLYCEGFLHDLRLIQLCTSHEGKEKQFREQGRRASQDTYLEELQQKDTAAYLELLAQFVDVYLDLIIGVICVMYL